MRSPLMASGCDDRRFRGNVVVLQMTGRGNHGVRIGAGMIRRHPVVSRLRSLKDRWESGENSGLAQCQGGPLTSRGDALPQIHQVHALPDLGGGYGDPFQDNGIKFFARGGHKLEDSVEDRIEGLPGCICDLLTGAGVGRVVEGEIVADQRCISHLVDSGAADVPGLRIV